MSKFINSVLTGFIAGFILPIVLFFASYRVKLHEYEVVDIPRNLFMSEFLPRILSWCVIPNIILFFVLNWIGWYKAGKGILISTVSITIILILLKFIYSVL